MLEETKSKKKSNLKNNLKVKSNLKVKTVESGSSQISD